MNRDLIPETTDEQEALDSLDDTTFRPLPEMTASWEPLEISPEPPAVDNRPSRLRTYALMGAVAVVSFVAGGFTARMSSQMPVLFTEEAPITETTAAYEEPVTPVYPEEEAPADTVEETYESTPPSYDTGYDTTDEQQDTTDDQQDDSELRWDFDREGDRSISYDTDNNRVTLDYDGYSFGLDLDGLTTDTTTQDQDESDSSQNDSYQYYNYYDTGDDATDSERDSHGWRGWSYGPIGTGYHS